MINLVSLTLLSLQSFWQNSDGYIYDFWISGQSLIKENSHNSRTGDDIDLNLTRETKQHKKSGSAVISSNCDVIVVSPIYGQFGAIQKPDFGCIICKTYIFIYNNLFIFKVLFLTKNAVFCKKC